MNLFPVQMTGINERYDFQEEPFKTIDFSRHVLLSLPFDPLKIRRPCERVQGAIAQPDLFERHVRAVRFAVYDKSREPGEVNFHLVIGRFISGILALAERKIAVFSLCLKNFKAEIVLEVSVSFAGIFVQMTGFHAGFAINIKGQFVHRFVARPLADRVGSTEPSHMKKGIRSGITFMNISPLPCWLVQKYYPLLFSRQIAPALN